MPPLILGLSGAEMGCLCQTGARSCWPTFSDKVTVKHRQEYGPQGTGDASEALRIVTRTPHQG